MDDACFVSESRNTIHTKYLCAALLVFGAIPNVSGLYWELLAWKSEDCKMGSGLICSSCHISSVEESRFSAELWCVGVTGEDYIKVIIQQPIIWTTTTSYDALITVYISSGKCCWKRLKSLSILFNGWHCQPLPTSPEQYEDLFFLN